MPGFDSKSLVEFRAARYLCLTCNSMIFDLRFEWRDGTNYSDVWAKCPTCSQLYLSHIDSSPSFRDGVFAHVDHLIKFDNLLDHSRTLAGICARFGRPYSEGTEIRTLFNALLEAKSFVHFSTWGIGHLFIGPLKMIAGRIPVRGIISSVRPHKKIKEWYPQSKTGRIPTMARKQEHPVVLSAAERAELEAIVRKGKQKARIIRRAQTLLWSDEGKPDSEIAPLHGITPLTVARTRQRWVKEKSLEDKPRPGRVTKLDGKQEAFLVALACSDAPEGYERWTMQLLADRLIALRVIEEPISDETVRRTLKKTS